jgi:hypothetical protein
MTLKALSQFDCVLDEPKSSSQEVWSCVTEDEIGRYLIVGYVVARDRHSAISHWGSEGHKFILPPDAEIQWGTKDIGRVRVLSRSMPATGRWYAEIT